MYGWLEGLVQDGRESPVFKVKLHLRMDFDGRDARIHTEVERKEHTIKALVGLR